MASTSFSAAAASTASRNEENLMPLYLPPGFTTAAPPQAIYEGEQSSPPIVNAEQLGAGNFSQRINIADKDGSMPRPVTVTFLYASVPASVQYDIYVAWDDGLPPTTWTKVGTTTNVNGDQVTIQRAAAGGPNFRFICVREVVSPGVNATVKVQQ
jgi:hypothetical protein